MSLKISWSMCFLNTVTSTTLQKSPIKVRDNSPSFSELFDKLQNYERALKEHSSTVESPITTINYTARQQNFTNHNPGSSRFSCGNRNNKAQWSGTNNRSQCSGTSSSANRSKNNTDNGGEYQGLYLFYNLMNDNNNNDANNNSLVKN
ncbi:hypothetical protein LXL04_020662 [Taraxacum kok-saghyz]